MKIVLIGPPGSGKSTQADILSRVLGIPRISAGEILRKKYSHIPEIRRALDHGDLVADEILNNALRPVFSLYAKGGFILDGFPRSIRQAMMLEEFRPDIVIHLDVRPEESLRRISKRGRSDDRRWVIEKRILEYENFTRPVIHFYGVRGKLIRIPAEAEKEEVSRRILGEISRILRARKPPALAVASAPSNCEFIGSVKRLTLSWKNCILDGEQR